MVKEFRRGFGRYRRVKRYIPQGEIVRYMFGRATRRIIPAFERHLRRSAAIEDGRTDRAAIGAASDRESVMNPATPARTRLAWVVSHGAPLAGLARLIVMRHWNARSPNESLLEPRAKPIHKVLRRSRSGQTEVHYWSFDGTTGSLARVSADGEYLKRLLDAEAAFWQLVMYHIWPEPAGGGLDLSADSEMAPGRAALLCAWRSHRHWSRESLDGDRGGNLMPEHRSNHVIICEQVASDSAMKKLRLTSR
jgi:hypothetical protein